MINWRGIFRRDQSLGARGERLAARFLSKAGYRIIERNLEVHDDEADIVALDPDGRTIVVVEVKSRRDDGTVPEAAIGGRKQKHLIRLAMKLQQQQPFRDRPFRFDAIAVVIPERGDVLIRHTPSAFDAR